MSKNKTRNKFYAGFIAAIMIAQPIMQPVSVFANNGNSIVTEAAAAITESTDAIRTLVTFDPNGGSMQIGSNLVYVPSGAQIQPPTNPTRLNHAFLGWFTQRNGGTQWNFNDPLPYRQGGLTLYARWSLTASTLNFNTNGGTPAQIASAIVDRGQPLRNGFPQEPTREGYLFGGWFEGNTNANNITAPQDGRDFNLVARWVSTHVNVNFDLNGGTSAAIDSLYHPVGALVPVPSEAPEREGYSFVGWEVQRNTAGNVVNNWSLITPSTQVGPAGENFNLRARWVSNYITVSFIIAPANVANIEPIRVRVGTSLASLPIPDGAPAGQSFVGWFTAATGGQLASIFFAEAGQDRTFHARFSPDRIEQELRIRFNNEFGTAPSPITRDVSINPTVNVTTNQLGVTPNFISDGKGGVNFGGWLLYGDTRIAPISNPLNTILSVNQTYGAYRYVDLYAHFSRRIDLVRHNGTGASSGPSVATVITGNVQNGGLFRANNIPALNTATHETFFEVINQQISLSNGMIIPVRHMHAFAGWYTSPVGGVRVNPNDAASIAENVIFNAQGIARLYARYERVLENEVRIFNNRFQGDETFIEFVVSNNARINFGTGSMQTRADGARHIGWAVQNSDSSYTWFRSSDLTNATVINGNIDIHAIWTWYVQFDNGTGVQWQNRPARQYFYTVRPNNINGVPPRPLNGITTPVQNLNWIDGNPYVNFSAINALPTSLGRHFRGFEVLETNEFIGDWNQTPTLEFIQGLRRRVDRNMTIVPVFTALPPSGSGGSGSGGFGQPGPGQPIRRHWVHFETNDLREEQLTTPQRIASQHVIEGDTIIMPATPGRNHHMFVAWYTTPQRIPGTQLQTSPLPPIYEEKTLYADWHTSLTIEFINNGALHAILDSLYNGLLDIALVNMNPPMHYRNAGVFSHWVNSYGEKWVQGAFVNLENLRISNYTERARLYAVFTYFPTVTLVRNDGTDAQTTFPSIPTPTYAGMIYTFYLERAEKTNHRFLTWNRLVYGEFVPVSLGSFPVEEDITLYATWREFPRVILVNEAHEDIVTLHANPTNEEQTEFNFDLPRLARAGYEFLGWYNSNGNFVTLYGEVEISEEYTRFYARWHTLPRVTLNFNDEVEEGHELLEARLRTPSVTIYTNLNIEPREYYFYLSIPYKPHHNFLGWFMVNSDEEAVYFATEGRQTTEESIYLQAKWAMHEIYTVTFISEGGIVYQVNRFERTQLATPVLPNDSYGRRMLRWYLQGSETGAFAIPGQNILVSGDKVFVAFWVYIPGYITITFENIFRDGTPTVINIRNRFDGVDFDTHGVYLTEIQIPSVSSDSRYIPVAVWFIYGRRYEGGFTREQLLNKRFTEDTLLIQEARHVISFNPNGGIFPNGSISTRFQTEYHGMPFSHEVIIPHKQNHIFRWWVDADGNHVDIEGKTIISHISLYAYWQAEVILTFDALNGLFENGESTRYVRVIIGTTINLLGKEEPTLEDHTFKGWSKTRTTNPRDAIHEITVNSDVTLFAIWRHNDCLILRWEDIGIGYYFDNGDYIRYRGRIYRNINIRFTFWGDQNWRPGVAHSQWQFVRESLCYTDRYYNGYQPEEPQPNPIDPNPQPTPDQLDQFRWNPYATYYMGDLVYHNGYVWRALHVVIWGHGDLNWAPDISAGLWYRTNITPAELVYRYGNAQSNELEEEENETDVYENELDNDKELNEEDEEQSNEIEEENETNVYENELDNDKELNEEDEEQSNEIEEENETDVYENELDNDKELNEEDEEQSNEIEEENETDVYESEFNNETEENHGGRIHE